MMFVVITRDRAIVTSNVVEVVKARNEVVDICCPLGTAAKVDEERAPSGQSIAK